MAECIIVQPASFEWIIENFSMCAQLPGKPVCSPDFFIDAFGTKIAFHLYPKGNGKCNKYMSLNIVRRSNLDYDQFYQDKDFLIEVSLLLDGPATEDEVLLKDSISFSKEMCLNCPDLVERDTILLNEPDYLKLKIDISPIHQTEPESLWSCNWDDLVQLSSDIFEGLKSGNHSDVVLKGSGGESFKIHKAILVTRYPNFANALRLLESNKKIVETDIDPDTLEVLLKYLYSGVIQQASLTSKLFDMIFIKELGHLHQVIYPIPDHVQFTTNINVRRGNFLWKIPSFSTLPNNALFNHDFSCDPFFNWTKLKFKLHFIRNDQNELSVAFGAQRAYLGEPLSIKCKMSITGVNIFERDIEHLFENENEIFFPEIIGNEFFIANKESFLLDDNLCIKFDVTLSNGAFTSETDDVLLRDEPARLDGISGNLGVFQQDLIRLYRNAVFSDVTISVEGEMFQAHKVILSARSPVFRKMFEQDTLEEKTWPVIIKDFESPVVKAMLSYMYCGLIDYAVMDFEFSAKLYAVASAHELLQLKKKCRMFFEEILSANNVGRILKLAYIHLDGDLKKIVHTFVYDNPGQVRDSEDWNNVMNEDPSIAEDMLCAVWDLYSAKNI